jgi:MFS family permease
MQEPAAGPTGMRAFGIIWVGQVASLLGTAMSQFGLTLWAYEVTGKATPLALVGVFFMTPMVVLGPVVGTLVDRGNRKLMMMVSDLAAACVTAILLALYVTDALQIWHLYVSAAIAGAFQGFQWPAYSAAISLMLPKRHYARANAMLEMAGPASAVFAPLLAGALIGPLGLVGLLLVDLVSAAAAVGTLLFAYIPQPPRTEAGREGTGTFFQEAVYGFRYLFARPSLLGLQTIFMVGNFFSSLAGMVLAAMILARTGNNELIFGTVQSAGAIGGVMGGVAMSAWGGPRRRIHGVLLGWFAFGLLGQVGLGLARSLPLWVAAALLRSFVGPVINGSNQAIWQAKVAPDVQGRVFATRRLVAWLVTPLAGLLAGPLADQVLEPALAEGGALVPAFGWLVGTGTGAGMALQFIGSGVLVALTALAGYLFPAIRDAEEILPDHEAVVEEVAAQPIPGS